MRQSRNARLLTSLLGPVVICGPLSLLCGTGCSGDTSNEMITPPGPPSEIAKDSMNEHFRQQKALKSTKKK